MPGLARDEIHQGAKTGLLTSQEKLILLRREDGWTYQHIANEYGYTKQYAVQVAQRGSEILRSGKRPKLGRPPKPMPEEYTVKLTRRQRDSLKDEGLKAMLLEAEAKAHPYWTHTCMVLIDQVLEQNVEDHGWRDQHDPFYQPPNRKDEDK